MIFTAPSFLPAVPSPLPLQEPIGDFCIAANLNKTAGEGAPFVEASIDRPWKTTDIDARVTQLAAALSAAWKLTPGENWHKTVAILATNSVDILILSWAIHRLGGGCLMLQPTSSADEIAEHLQRIPPFAFFMSDDLLPLGQGALQKIGSVEKLPVYRLQIATKASAASEKIQDVPKFPTLDDLIEEHKDATHVEKQKWTGNEAAQRVAYYCTTSGTSGFQRIVAITHENMIASILQATSFYQATRDRGSEVTLGFLPFNHIYGLLITHSLMHYGDSVVVHRGFNLMEILMSITRYRINTLYLVPPIINALSRNAAILDKFDLSSVTSIVSGGGPLNQEAFLRMQKARPNWRICSGWGQTESSGIGSLSSPSDICAGSSGILLPGVRIRLRDDEGNIVESLDAMGEIEIASPSVLRGYIDAASDSILPLPADDGEFWWPTGDVGRFGTTPSGATHLWVVDRIRDMIKVKGIQVAPGQIESHLTSHPAVAETAVIGVPNEVAGERALAFVIREPSYKPEMSNTELQKALRDHNDLTLPEVCRLQDRIVIVEQIPKSASGKVLKRELRKQVAHSNGQSNGTNKSA